MSKAITHNLDKLFTSITENAFEFLEKSLDEFEESPKFSIIHFASAIELFMKARLLLEHWSLLVEKVDSAKIDELFSGKLKTVNPDTARNRLKHIARDPVPPDAENIFKKIAEHRNRAIHFVYHNDQAVTELENIVEQQCIGWRHLQGLFERNWKRYFRDFADQINSIESRMQRHQAYLKAKYTSKINDIYAHTKNGSEVINCRFCGYDSMLVTDIEGAISSASCIVCSTVDTIITLECPDDDCHQKIVFNSYLGPPESCPSCKGPVGDWVHEGLDTGEFVTSDNMYDQIDINCPYCLSGYHSVVEHYDHYICTSCFEYSKYFGVCESCNEGQLGGVSEFTYHSGCDFCDGQADWDKDDY